MDRLTLTGGHVLLPRDGLQVADVRLEDGHIAAIGRSGNSAQLDARGLLVLPGIVDLHGDAFERQLQPRPGVGFSTEIAWQDTEAQLLANGITTAFHGVTLSWEPGLRSLKAWHASLNALEAKQWTCDMRVHLRWEAYNLEALDTALADIGAGRVHLLAFNDHTPPILKKINDPVVGAKYSERAGMKLDDFRALAAEVGARQHAVPAALDRIGEAARRAGLPMASHDDETIDTRRTFRARGARICEFPMAEEVAQEAREAGDWVVMGCPNVVRGGSHLGWASAARMVRAGICRVLTSDYYYPAMLHAAMVLAGHDVLGLDGAWGLISKNPATAAGLNDRGSIEEGMRADLVLVDQAQPKVVATIVAGRIGYLTAEGATRMSLASQR